MDMPDKAQAERFGVAFDWVEADGVRLRVAVAGSGPLVLLVHGFPECWYSWRHQFQPLVAAGYKVVAPDLRGYGGSTCPLAISDYDMQHMTSDMAAVARQFSADQPCVIVGHDWGAPIAWNSALLYPQVFRAVAGMSVPHTPPGEVVGIDLFRKIFTDRGLFFYMIYFQDVGVAEAELEADPARSIRLFYSAIAGDAADGAWPVNKPHGQKLFDGVLEPTLPLAWLSGADIETIASLFAHTGFRGPLNRYRNFHRDYDFLKSSSKTMIQQPSLYITGEKDMVNLMYPGGPIAAMRPHLKSLQRTLVLPGCGHWTQQERPAQVNHALIDWLAALPAG